MIAERLMNDFPLIFPLGDAAATIELGNRIDTALNGKVLGMLQWFETHRFEGLKDCIPAYSSLTVLYDPYLVQTKVQPDSTVFEWVSRQLSTAFQQSGNETAGPSTIHRLPVCYEGEYAPDLPALAKEKQLSESDIIGIHTAGLYRVYMIGFLPGFAYLGPVDERITAHRKQQPVMVAPGSVGIAGMQTGIYPVSSPGGWQIIGRTPVKLFDPHVPIPVPVKPGDQVQFYPVTPAAFNKA